MNKNRNYYKKIFDKFGRKDDQKILPQTNHTCIENIDQSNKMNNKYASLPSKSIYSTPKSKRGLKLIRKEHYENIISYPSTQKKLSHNTFAEYIHVISDYQMNSILLNLELNINIDKMNISIYTNIHHMH